MTTFLPLTAPVESHNYCAFKMGNFLLLFGAWTLEKLGPSLFCKQVTNLQLKLKEE